ncbi:ATP-dependent endonuclease [Paenibacillus sp. FSL H8-0259]|jgi:putative ATP-dependent endonuclease of the OLD family|uniref:ATP-dependent nuclease n=1 Tax=Paenibacillus sp. FSL H8-0259 TaxID=1920423 RepID=UPI00096F77AE|nr:AAA family ATPase [Paenibacillus sp. FSL H8-0259]OMF24593.1 ATP-dependent endonuclease [Paenibacillus sp. FSL H8-0259]
MKLKKIKLSNFRSFGETEETITFNDLTAIIGGNSCGKTTFFNALLRLFGDNQKEREITRADFHLPPDVNPDSINQSNLFIEAIFEFPEVTEHNGIEQYTVPSFFNNFTVDLEEGVPPYIRIRLESTWQRSNQPEGIVDTNIFFIIAPENELPDSENRMSISQTYLSQIKVTYVPALRDPSAQLKMVSGTLLWRLIRRINFDNSFKSEISLKMQGVKDTLSEHEGITKIKQIIGEQWNNYHGDDRYSQLDLHFNTQDMENILKKIDPFFSPTEIENGYTVDLLGDGLRSLFYLSLVGALLKTEELTLKEMFENPEKSIDERMFSIIPPCLTIVCVEEPENHVAPHLLGKIIKNLRDISNNDNAQVILSSHSPAIVKRIDPQEIRHFRSCKTKRATLTRTITLPDKTEEAYKYVKEAVRAYPEIYFSSLVILGEGDSEEIIIPHVMDLLDDRISTHEVAVVPLGGRHVNHFWRLLYQLDIPFITLLDLDLERGGGGWGRIKYCLDQLLKNGFDKNVILEVQGGRVLSDEEFSKMHTWTERESLDKWVVYLAKYDIYFSAPLDIDFLMLEAFSDQYISLLSQHEGPEITIGEDNKKVLDLTSEDKASEEYTKRISSDVSATLKEGKTGVSKEGNEYNDFQRELMIWYRYFFLYRGKPSTHMRLLSESDPKQMKEKLPEVFNNMQKKIITKLKIKEKVES